MILSDDTIANLVDILVEREEEVAQKVLRLIAKRIGDIGSLKTTDILKLESLVKSGADMRKIRKYLSNLTNIQVKEIKKLIDQAARSAYENSEDYFLLTGVDYIPYEENKQLQKIVKTISNQTVKSYQNLSQTRAFMIRDNGRLRPTKMHNAYVKLLDTAIQASQSGVSDWHKERNNIVHQLAEQGIKTVEYSPESGRRYIQATDSATRRLILDGIRSINQGVQDEVGKEFGADGKEITVHAYPAPDHAPVQGHQFTNEEFDKLQNNEESTDVNGNHFKAFKRKIGQWNCRHFTFSIKIGYAKPNYTNEQLQEILDKNNKGFDYNGKHMTMYECTQMQRKMEREIRKAKRAYILAKEANTEDLMTEYKDQVKSLTRQYKEFSKACGLSTKPKNLYVEGYK